MSRLKEKKGFLAREILREADFTDWQQKRMWGDFIFGAEQKIPSRRSIGSLCEWPNKSCHFKIRHLQPKGKANNTARLKVIQSL